MRMRKFTALVVLGAMLIGLPVLGGSGLQIDEIIVQYPAGFTKVLALDVAPFLADPDLDEGVIGPLTAANHPVAGIVRTIQLFEIPPSQVRFVAHGEGPKVTSFSLIAGTDLSQTFGALMGLRAAAAAPGSPFTHFDLEEMDGMPVAFVGGNFGPVTIEWAYIPTEGGLWIGTEIAFQPDRPDTDRLRATTRLMVDKLLGRRGAGAFSELHIAIQVRGGRVAFVRTSGPGERPMETGEQAMGFALTLGDAGRGRGRVDGRFALRFDTETAAASAEGRLENGTSPYLAQDLYQAELVGVQRSGRTLNVDVTTDLRGLVGLLMLVMPF